MRHVSGSNIWIASQVSVAVCEHSFGSANAGLDAAAEKHLWSGSGRAAFVSGAIYEGQWDAGCMHGVGRLGFPDGMVYQGDFFKNTITGTGVSRAQRPETRCNPEKPFKSYGHRCLLSTTWKAEIALCLTCSTVVAVAIPASPCSTLFYLLPRFLGWNFEITWY